MAIYHCSCKIISRGQTRSNGQSGSAVASAAYRSGSKLTNEFDGESHDYRYKTESGEVVHSEIILCKTAPEQYLDRATLWNAVEKFEKNGNAQLAREYEVALPKELSREEQVQLARAFCQENFVSKGMIADFSIHDKGDGNPHAHIMLTMRGIKENGEWAEYKEKKVFTLDEKGERIPIIDENTGLQKVDGRNRKQWVRHYEKVNEWNKPKLLTDARKSWADCVNRELEKKGLPDRVDHRTLKEQGIDRIPTIHVGPAATNMEKKAADKGEVFESRKGSENREIKKANMQVAAIDKEMSEVERSIGSVKEDIAWSQIHEEISAIHHATFNGSWSEAAQLEGLERLDKLAVLTAETSEAQKWSAYHAGTAIDDTPYLDYHTGKAAQDQAFIRADIGRCLNFIRTAYPHHETYEYGKITPLDIDTRMRTDRDEGGFLRVAQRSPAERSVILNARQAHKELCAVYDTTQLHRLIAQQAEAQRWRRPTRSRDEELVRQIQESFANLRFMEQKEVFSIAQAQAAVKSLGEQYNVCLGNINEAESMVAKLEAVVKLPYELKELKKRVDQNKDNPEYRRTQYNHDIKQMKSCIDRMKQANITDSASAKEARATMGQYKERIGELKGALAGFSAELEGYKRCIATLDRIDRENGRPRPALSGPVQEPARKQERAADLPKAEPERKQPLDSTIAAAAKVAEQPKQAAKETSSVDQPKEEPRSVPFDVQKVAMQLAQHRADVIRESIKAKQPSYYTPNVAYRQQAQYIADCISKIQDYKTALDKLAEERSSLGLFLGKQKKDIDGKVKAFKTRLADEEKKLEPIAQEMGFDVKDIAGAETAVKRLRELDAREDAKAKAALANVGAAERANVAKLEYIALVKIVPEDKKQAVLAELERMEKQDSGNQGGGARNMEEHSAAMAALKELDATLQKHLVTGKEERQKTKWLDWGE